MTDPAAIIEEALAEVRAWAAETRPLLSEPEPGKEWQVYLHPITGQDFDTDANTVKLRYEWVLVDVASVP